MKHFSKRLIIFIVMGLLASLVGCSSTTALNSADKSNSATTSKKESAAVKKRNETAQTDQAKVAVTAQNATTGQTQAATSGETEQNGTNQSTQTQTTVPAPAAPKTNATTSVSSVNTTVSASQAAPAKQPSTPTAPQATPAQAQTVTFSIVGPKEDHSGDRGASTVKITNGESLLDVLLATVGKGNVDYSGSGATAYVSGINNIYEFDYGAKSGWVFKVNGVSLSKGIGVVSVKNGDRIECLYTE